ncbi:hypothetical protein EDB87DRAFT_1275441 [Lactarius vividus]|nr:hypothetical protein EDB87DRAFT_1275441 [Lactarius vividus]
MRKPWAKRVEAPSPLAPVVHPKVATRQSVGVQTDSVDTVRTATSVLAASEPAVEESSQTHSVHDTKVSEVSLPPAGESTSTEVESEAPRGLSERELPMEVDSTSNITITSSVDNSVTVPTPHAKHDDVPLDTSIDPVVSDNLERWSPSVPAPTAVLATVRPVDDSSEGADSSDLNEDQKPVITTPERPWSPSVPAALTTQGLSRRRTRDRETEKLDNARRASQTKSTLLTETPPSSSPTPAPLTSPPDDNGFTVKLEPTFATSFSAGSPMTAFVGKLSNHSSSDEDNKVPQRTPTHLSSRTNSFMPALTQILPPTEKPPPSPSAVLQFARSGAIVVPPLLPVDRHLSPSFPHPHSPGLRQDQSPSRLSPVSSRGSFNYGPLENSATNIPSHTSSPKLPARKPQTFSWPPFRPNLDEGSTDFDPPFRAGPDFCEPPPPPPFRPTSGPATVRTYATATPGRPAVISSSNAIPLAPRHSCIPPSAPGGPSSPTIPPFAPPSISPQPLSKPPQGMAPDGNYPPRQPRAEAGMQAMTSAPLGQGVVPRSQPQYHRQREYLAFVATGCSCGSWLRSRGANGLI